jgi:hypothetical protein
MSNSLDNHSVQKIVTSYNLIEEVKSTIQSFTSQKKSIPIIEQILISLNSIDEIVKRPLSRFSNQTTAGTWAQSQVGIGPVLSSGLISYVDIKKAPTVTTLWRYSGLDPSFESKETFNGELKSLCWKIGSSFSKNSSNSDCFYGKLYLKDKERRNQKNNQGLYADKAKQILDNLPYKYRSDKAILSQGKLSHKQIDAQARRFAVKIFLSHYHTIAYYEQYGTHAVRPSYITINGDKEYVEIPNSPF